jgi:hypothetical protein
LSNVPWGAKSLLVENHYSNPRSILGYLSPTFPQLLDSPSKLYIATFFPIQPVFTENLEDKSSRALGEKQTS